MDEPFLLARAQQAFLDALSRTGMTQADYQRLAAMVHDATLNHRRVEIIVLTNGPADTARYTASALVQ